MKEQISLASPGSSSHSQVSEIKTGPESHRKNEEETLWSLWLGTEQEYLKLSVPPHSNSQKNKY